MDLAKRAYVMRRLDRRERWVSLWLTRLIAFLSALETIAIARALHGHIAHLVDLLSDCVVDFIARRAAWSPGFQRRIARKRAVGCAVTIRGTRRIMASPRAVLGSALRRALKARNLKGRAEALLRVLKKRDLWVAYLARRIARGQTRIYSAHARVAMPLPLHQPSLTLRLVPLPKTGFGEDLRGAAGPP